MIPERFMVAGKRLSDGKVVIGILCPPSYPGYAAKEPWYIAVPHPPEDEWCSHHYVAIDIATVEPVAVKVKREHTPVGDYCCPNCAAAFITEAGLTNYCGNCGQRLDWKV